MQPIVNGFRKAKDFFVIGVVALGFGGAVEAVVNVEDFMVYETAYLDSCEAQHSGRTCRCAMETIQERITFHEFAEAVYRTDGNLPRDSRWGDTARRAVEACATPVAATAEAQ